MMITFTTHPVTAERLDDDAIDAGGDKVLGRSRLRQYTQGTI